MIEIIPNWHPIWVHFAIALLATGAGIYLVLGWRAGENPDSPTGALIVARWMLWLGTGAALVALLTGYWASTTVAHDDLAHANMIVHRNWAFATTIIFIAVVILEYFRKHQARASILSALFLVAGGATLVMTGLEGAENVYKHGLGVQRLAELSTHEHDHEEGSEGSGSATDEADDGHSHSHAAMEAEIQPGTAMDDDNHPAGRVAAALGQAIEQGDVEQLKVLMTPEVVIFESGNVESSLAEYESHHMQSDIAFMSAMDIELISRRVIESGDMATVITRSRIHGLYKDKDVDLVSTETLVLEKFDGQWKIVHIHWSSS